jgi:hypothetical protein
LFALIAKGLGWFHWQIILKQGYSAVAAFFLDSGAQFFGRLLSESKKLSHTSGDLGHGTFSYEGIQFAHDPNETLWRLSMLWRRVLWWGLGFAWRKGLSNYCDNRG